MGGAVPVVLPVFLLLLLPTHLLLDLQDDARELTEIVEVLDVGKLQRMRQVDLHGLLPGWDVGISLEMGSNRPVSSPHPSSPKNPSGPCSLFPELSMSPPPPRSQKRNFKSKAKEPGYTCKCKSQRRNCVFLRIPACRGRSSLA